EAANARRHLRGLWKRVRQDVRGADRRHGPRLRQLRVRHPRPGPAVRALWLPDRRARAGAGGGHVLLRQLRSDVGHRGVSRPRRTWDDRVHGAVDASPISGPWPASSPRLRCLWVVARCAAIGEADVDYEVTTENLRGRVTSLGSASGHTVIIDRPTAGGGGGLGFNGAELMHLAIA